MTRRRRAIEATPKQLEDAIPTVRYDRDKTLLACASLERRGLYATCSNVSALTGIVEDATRELLRRLEIDGLVQYECE